MMRGFGGIGKLGNETGLKLLAAASMAADHTGWLLFPGCEALRIIGRLAFPIFAYYIYIGCLRTHSKGRYGGRILALGLACMIVWHLISGQVYGNILITFSLSIGVISLMQRIKQRFIQPAAQLAGGAAAAGLCLLPLWALTDRIVIDYGLWGIYVPVLPELLRTGTAPRVPAGRRVGLEDIGFGFGLWGLAQQYGGIQYASLAALALLVWFRAGPVSYRLPKRFLYYFYPIHFLVIYGIYLAMQSGR